MRGHEGLESIAYSDNFAMRGSKALRIATTLQREARKPCAEEEEEEEEAPKNV